MNINNISAIYQIFNLIYGIVSPSLSSRNDFSRLSFPVSISIPYGGSSSKKEEYEIKDLDFFQMEKLLTWMKLFFEEDDEKKDENICENKDGNITKKAYKKELYNIYVGIKSDYKQYQGWKKYNNGLWILSSYRSKNSKDLGKKIVSDIQLFNEGLKMFSLINKL
jgi:hypothetical protein